MYLITLTRSNLLYSVGLCARFMSNSGPDHFRALNRIWRYILHIINLNIAFCPNGNFGLKCSLGGQLLNQTLNYRLFILIRKQCCFFNKQTLKNHRAIELRS